MAGDEVRKDLEELRDQVTALQKALSRALEPYQELTRYIEQLQSLAQGYLRLVDLYQRHGSVSPDLVIPGLKDDVSRHIVTALFDKPNRNISEITEAVKARRGTASRRIVRERLRELEHEGVVVGTPGSKARTFRVSEEVVAKWSRILLPDALTRKEDKES